MAGIKNMIRHFFAALTRKLRGRGYRIDPNVPVTALLSLGIRRMVSLVRGAGRVLLFQGRLKVVFMEGGVEIRNIASVRFGSVVSLGKGVLIDGLSRDGVCLGDGVSIGRHSILRCTGTLSNMGVGISIGDGTGMDAFCFVGGAGGVYIGKNVLVGQHASFHAEDHCFEDLEKLIKEQGTTRRGIYIGDNCWIGANVTFLDGCTVGSGSIVGAGSIVRGSLPDNCIAVGVPARVVRSR